jgi:hypothetical protein
VNLHHAWFSTIVAIYLLQDADTGIAIFISSDDDLAFVFSRHPSVVNGSNCAELDIVELMAFPDDQSPTWENEDESAGWEILGLSLADIAGAQESSNQPLTAAPSANQTTQPEFSDELLFWVNGAEQRVRNPDAFMTLVEYLHSIGLTGTKVKPKLVFPRRTLTLPSIGPAFCAIVPVPHLCLSRPIT